MKLLRNQDPGWLVIHFNKEEWHWYCQLPGESLRQGKTLHTLPAAPHAATLLLLPGERVMLVSVTQPGLTPDAARWLLEPLMLEEMESQHVVTLQRQGDQHIIAAVDAQWLRQLLSMLADAGYVPQRVLPDTLALAPGTRLSLGDHWLVRLPDGSGLQLPASALAQLPQLQMVDEITEEPLLHLANRARVENGNLLQGTFAKKRPLRRPLIGLAAALALCIISIIGTPLWQGWQAQRALTTLNQQLLARYQAYFPKESPVNPRRQFSRKAAQGDVSPGELGFLSLLQQFGSCSCPTQRQPTANSEMARRNPSVDPAVSRSVNR
ncbi:type II secretion system protein GspL [Enterobacter mori]